MTETEILSLYEARAPEATAQAENYLGTYLRAIGKNILGSKEDSEECCNDTMLRLWETIPPQQPTSLKAYAAKIMRNIAIDRYRSGKAGKRSGITEVIDELADCLPDTDSVETALDQKELSRAIGNFLGTLDETGRSLFIRRYFYGEGIPALAGRYHLTTGNVRQRLHRTREKLREFLEERGITV